MRSIVDRVLEKMIARANHCDREDGWLEKACANSESLENLFKEIEQEKTRAVKRN